MLKIRSTKKFDKDLRTSFKRGKSPTKLKAIISLLAKQQELPAKNKDHNLKGNYIGTRECHIEPDWLLIYRVSNELLILERIGTHSDLFR
jgi:mRNA interferase YafQ